MKFKWCSKCVTMHAEDKCLMEGKAEVETEKFSKCKYCRCEIAILKGYKPETVCAECHELLESRR